jgi:hypothetical protein
MTRDYKATVTVRIRINQNRPTDAEFDSLAQAALKDLWVDFCGGGWGHGSERLITYSVSTLPKKRRAIKRVR